MKILPVGAKLSHADGRTDSLIDRQTMTKITSRSPQFYQSTLKTRVQYIFPVCSIRNVLLEIKL